MGMSRRYSSTMKILPKYKQYIIHIVHIVHILHIVHIAHIVHGDRVVGSAAQSGSSKDV